MTDIDMDMVMNMIRGDSKLVRHLIAPTMIYDSTATGITIYS